MSSYSPYSPYDPTMNQFTEFPTKCGGICHLINDGGIRYKKCYYCQSLRKKGKLPTEEEVFGDNF